MFGWNWEEIEKEFLRQGLGSILNATPKVHAIAPRSLRKNPTFTTVDKKQKKPQKPQVR